MKQYMIGFIDDTACGSKETSKQIEDIMQLDLALEHNGEKITWGDINNPAEPRTLLQAIVRDREVRIDQKTLMANRPLFALLTEENGRIVRLEYYEGHDYLSCTYDLRSKELQDENLKLSYAE